MAYDDDCEHAPGCPNSPAVTIEKLRDDALEMFDHYLAHRLSVKVPKATPEIIEIRRKFLSVAEAENIVKEFNCDEDLPEGMCMIGARSVDELRYKMNMLLNALMCRIMSNVVNEGVNLGLIDCAFDDEVDAFAFTPSDKGEKLLKQIKKSKKKKTKSDDPKD